MKLSIYQIHPDGLELDFNENEKWVRQIFQETVQEKWKEGEKIALHFSLSRQDRQVQLQMNLSFNLSLPCDRCSELFLHPVKIQTRQFFYPLYESDRQRQIEKAMEVELTEEDMNFSYYREDEINLSQFLSEQILLEVPIHFLCRPDCKGLCPNCGADWNLSICSCNGQKQKTSHFSVLEKYFKN